MKKEKIEKKYKIIEVRAEYLLPGDIVLGNDHYQLVESIDTTKLHRHKYYNLSYWSTILQKFREYKLYHHEISEGKLTVLRYG